MRVIVLSGSGLSADSGLPTFRGEGGLYENQSAEEFLSAASYARDPDAVEVWIERLRQAAAAVRPNAAHQVLAAYQRRYPDTVLLTQNVDLLLEQAGAREVVHLHGRLDEARCLGHSHVTPLGIDAPGVLRGRCGRCHSRLRSNVVLFGERAPAYEVLWHVLRHARQQDVLVVVGTQGNVLPVREIARGFPGRTILSNLHASEWIDEGDFTAVMPGAAAEVLPEVERLLDEWRRELSEVGGDTVP